MVVLSHISPVTNVVKHLFVCVKYLFKSLAHFLPRLSSVFLVCLGKTRHSNNPSHPAESLGSGNDKSITCSPPNSRGLLLSSLYDQTLPGQSDYLGCRMSFTSVFTSF